MSSKKLRKEVKKVEKKDSIKDILEQAKKDYLGKFIKITKTFSDDPEKFIFSFRVDDIKIERSNELFELAIEFFTKQVVYNSCWTYKLSPIEFCVFPISIKEDWPTSKYITIQFISEEEFKESLESNIRYIRDYLDLLKRRYIGKSLEMNLESDERRYCKIKDFRLCLDLHKIEVRFSETIDILRIHCANYEELKFIADEKTNNNLVFDILKYSQPLTRVEYNFIKIIPDDDYDEIKRNTLDLIIHKHNGNIESDYNGNIIFALGSGYIKY